MEPLKFRPTKVLLVFWIIGIAITCIPVAGFMTSLWIETNTPLLKVFSMGYLIPFIISSTYAVLFFHTIRYELDNRYITKASGVLWKKRRSIPLEKITNLDVRQGPIERILGYGKIWVFTPSTGAATPEEKLAGITQPHDIKQTMIERSENAEQPPSMIKQKSNIESNEAMVSLLSDIRDSLKNIETSLSHEKRVP